MLEISTLEFAQVSIEFCFLGKLSRTKYHLNMTILSFCVIKYISLEGCASSEVFDAVCRWRLIFSQMALDA